MMNRNLWRKIWREALVILGTAGSFTIALWVKERFLERLVGSKVIDKDILERGIGKQLPAVVPPPRSEPTSNSQHPLWASYRPNGNSIRRGYGEVEVDGWEGPQLVKYSGKFETRDGHVLYRHDTELRPDHLGPCPLLKTRTPCKDCVWYIDKGSYEHEPACAAIQKLEDCADDYLIGVEDMRRQMEHFGN